MTASFEHVYYENPRLWDMERYTGPDTFRAQQVAHWLPADVKSVLDVGCGNGLFTRQLPKTLHVVSIDRSQAALHQMEGPRCAADAAALPFSNAAFDAVVALEVLEHLPYPVFQSALHELQRIARRYVVVTVPYCEDRLLAFVTCPLCHCHFHPYHHVRSFARRDLETLFSIPQQLQLVQAAGIFPIQPLLFPRLRLTIGHLRGREKPFPWYAACPQCGYYSGAAPAESGPQAATRTSWLKRLWPKRKSFLWWIALYEKGTKT